MKPRHRSGTGARATPRIRRSGGAWPRHTRNLACLAFGLRAPLAPGSNNGA